MAALSDDAELEEIVDEDEDTPDKPAPSGNRAEHEPNWRGPSQGRWLLFVVIAVGVVVVDQLTKMWITGAVVQPGGGFSVLGSWLNFVYGQNSGILFGMVPQSAGAFAIVSLVVIGLIVVYHQKAGRGVIMSVATSLLLGGAIGNLIDRLHYGAVVDWIDMGIGTWRFWTYNVADAAITTSLILIFVAAMFPAVAEWGTDD
jgi:signal peptidase II